MIGKVLGNFLRLYGINIAGAFGVEVEAKRVGPGIDGAESIVEIGNAADLDQERFGPRKTRILAK